MKLLNAKNYTGVDVSKTVLDIARRKFGNEPGKSFVLMDKFKTEHGKYDAAMSLDVLYHLTEDHVFEEYMASLFECAEKHVIIYSSNKEMHTVDSHVRHRKFSDWIARNADKWHLIHEEKNPYQFDWKDPENTSFADFYIYQKK